MTEEKTKIKEKKPKKEKIVAETKEENIETATEISEKESEKKIETEKKAEVKKKVEKPKKEEVVVKAYDVPISTRHSQAICKFIKFKKIGDAIKELQQVVLLKKAVPMKGEIPHRKGKGMMSGRYPVKATKNFIILLKSLDGNANANDMEEPIVVEAYANIASQPYGRFGRTRKKRTHIVIKAKDKIKMKKPGSK
jgi:ribosomal protein L22